MRLTTKQWEIECSTRLGVKFHHGFVDIPDGALKRLRETAAQHPQSVTPRPRPPRGFGDTLERWLAKVGGRRYKAWRKSIGKPCGCAKRQAWLNRWLPYR